MLADELSEQDIHGPGMKVEARDAQTVTVKPVKGTTRTLKAAGIYRGRGISTEPLPLLDNLKVGEQVYVQSAGDRARLLLDRDALRGGAINKRAPCASAGSRKVCREQLLFCT